jgi:hypothetical protein
MKQTRRYFLCPLGILVLTLIQTLAIFGCKGRDSEEITDANHKLRNLSNNIPSVRAVVKYETPKAKQCIVHIRNAHYAELTRDELTLRIVGANRFSIPSSDFVEKMETLWKEKCSIINKTQKNILDIMYYFKENYQTNESFAEVASRDITSEESDAYYNKILESLKKSGFFYEEFRNGEVDSYKYIPGAELILSGLGEMKLLETESYELNDLSWNSEKPEKYFDSREDYVLNKISQKNSPLCLLIYGGGHNFRNNIKKWNKTNPEKKFSLIEITPENYPEDE